MFTLKAFLSSRESSTIAWFSAGSGYAGMFSVADILQIAAVIRWSFELYCYCSSNCYQF